MAVAVQEVATEVDQVVDVVQSVYRSHLETVETGPLAEFVAAPGGAGTLRAVSIPAQHEVEVVLDEDADPAIVAVAAWALAERGWSITVLTRIDRLGEAHLALRGVPCRLQGWWTDGVGVEFGCYEVA